MSKLPIQKMVKEAYFVFNWHGGILPLETTKDLACHVLALVDEVERLSKGKEQADQAMLALATAGPTVPVVKFPDPNWQHLFVPFDGGSAMFTPGVKAFEEPEKSDFDKTYQAALECSKRLTEMGLGRSGD